VHSLFKIRDLSFTGRDISDSLNMQKRRIGATVNMCLWVRALFSFQTAAKHIKAPCTSGVLISTASEILHIPTSHA
jgi:hypothetical protein